MKQIFSPYRICPIGAHIDHQGGPVLGRTLTTGTLLAYEMLNSDEVHISRCLEKDPKKRLRDIGEARLMLEDPASLDRSDAESSAATSTIVPVWRRMLPWSIAAICAALAVWLAMRTQPATTSTVARVLIGVAPAERLLSGYSGDPSSGLGRPSRTAMTFSPDERSLVFSAEREGRVQLYLRLLDQLDAMPIAGTDGASIPFFSPDGQSLGFYANGAIRKVPVGGGPVVELCKTDLVFGASWSRTYQLTTGAIWC